jgi:glutaconate CoA-transferase, subunit A
MVDKCLSLHEAIDRYVHDGMSVAIEGFTSFICFAAGHEIMRQRRRDLTLIRMTPDLIYDQMIAAGVARKMVFSYMGNPGVGPLHCLRRAVEKSMPAPLELEEYSHYGLVARYMAGATRLPFYPLRSYLGSEMPLVNDQIKFIESPYGGEKVAVVPPINPDIAILHAQRADVQGNTQLWGLLGVQKEVAFAARKVIIVAEEIVDAAIIRADPNRTLIPGLIVDAVVHMPYGAHPSYVQGYYDRDNAFYIMWDELSRDPQKVQDWLDEWVYGVADHTEYLHKLGKETLERIHPGSAPATTIEYGAYQ